MAPVEGGPATARRRPYQVLAGAAIVAQMLLLCYFVVMVLWGGFWYLLNLGQGVALLMLALAWVRKRPLRVLPLPVVSLMLSLVFQAADPSMIPKKCTPAELSAAAELPPPPGIPPPQFRSIDGGNCTARFTTTLTGDQLLDHYRRAATQAGWEVADQEYGTSEPEEEPPAPGIGGLVMTKSKTIVSLGFVPASYEQPGATGSEADLDVRQLR